MSGGALPGDLEGRSRKVIAKMRKRGAAGAAGPARQCGWTTGGMRRRAIVVDVFVAALIKEWRRSPPARVIDVLAEVSMS